jgi:hypothetical protein
MSDSTPPADDRIHAAKDDEKAVEPDEKLSKSDLAQDELDRLESHD